MTSKTDPKQAGSDAQAIADEKARKEEIVEARIRAVREKNEKLMKRQQEIEEDRRNANKYSDMAVKKHHGHHEHATSPSGVAKESPSVGRGRGRGRGLLLQEMRKETLKAKQFEVKRRENIQREEEELRNQRSKSSRGNFLLDDNRVDMSRTTGRNERSWGGANFNQVVNRVQKEKEGFRSDRSRGNIEMTMSGKERREYQQWKEERKQIDEERKMRQKKEGNWSRVWDQKKSWDPKKKMWVYEDHNDDYNDARRRKQSDDHEDWGGDNRNRRHDNRGHRNEEHRPRQGFVQHYDHEASEEWGDDDRNSRRHKRGQSREERRPKQGFVEHDNRNMEASEEWGETGDAVVTHTKVSGQKTEADTKLDQQQGAVSSLGGEDWEDETPAPLDDEVKTSVTSIEAKSDRVENITPEQPIEPNDSETNQQFDDSRDLHNEESVTVDLNEQSHSDAPKPQREVKQRRRPHDAEANDQLKSEDFHKEQESATEESSPVDENSLQKPSMSNEESVITDKELGHVNEEREAVTDEVVKENGDGKSKNTVTEDNDKGDLPKTLTEQQVTTTQSTEEVKTNQSEDNENKSLQDKKTDLLNDKDPVTTPHAVQEQQVATTQSGEEVKTVESEDNVSKSSPAKKADLPNDKDTVTTPPAVQEQQVATNESAEEVKTVESEDNVSKSPAKKSDLPKLITKVDKKVTFDAEEDEQKTEKSESKDSRAMSVDIPPTPDFLKVDHSVNWGDFEIDEQEVVERW